MPSKKKSKKKCMCRYPKIKPNILVSIDYYLPGFKAGGPLRTIENMINRLSEHYVFSVITRDRDVGDKIPFNKYPCNKWINRFHSKIHYTKTNFFLPFSLFRGMKTSNYNVLYLNSFFSFWYTTFPLILRKLKFVPEKPCVLAPRGEFSDGALKNNWIKKRIFMYLVKKTKLYENIIWQASCQDEEKNINYILKKIVSNDKKNYVFKANDLLSPANDSKSAKCFREKQKKIRFVYISRIVPKKNLLFLLNVMNKIRIDCCLSIYGPLEDVDYWNKCLQIIKKMPKNVEIAFYGSVKPRNISKVFIMHDYFVFPTLGENFGHVIFESLLAGTPVITSNKTPWISMENSGISTLPLCQYAWRKKLEKCRSISFKKYKIISCRAFKYAKKMSQDKSNVRANKKMFSHAIKMFQ